MEVDEKKSCFVAGDMGGTKTILALFRKGGNVRQPLLKKRYASSAYTGPGEMLRDFVSWCNETPDTATIGIAGPVENNRVRVTNLGWETSGQEIAKEAGIKRVYLLNDLEAAVHGLSILEQEDISVVCPGEKAGGGGTRAIISAGTGLGEAAAISCGADTIKAIATEGGHASFAPFSRDSLELLAFLHKKMEHVSVEDVCSGRGIKNLYLFFLHKKGRGIIDEKRVSSGDVVPEIVENALSYRCPVCSAALQLFLDILASEAGNMAVRFLASGGVYLGGGIVPRVMGFIGRERFGNIFRAKGAMKGWLDRVPLKIVLNSNLTLYGAARKGSKLQDNLYQ